LKYPTRHRLDILGDLIRHPVFAVKLILRRIKEIPSKGPPKLLPGLRWHKADEFDRRYGVETSKSVYVTATNSPNYLHGCGYQASDEATIRWCIENCGMPPLETTFVDVGCGKGRALIIAAMYPFKRIIGIEYAPDLAKACRKNIKTLHLAERCEIVESDAAECKFPNGKLFVYICNPFNQVVFDRVLRNLASTQGQVRFGGRIPVAEEEILRTGIVRAIGSWEGLRLYEIASTHSKEDAGIS
jgi:SAM-dependent methyltransferase